MRVDLMAMGTNLRDTGALAKQAADAGFSGALITESGRTAYLSCAAIALAADIDILTGIAVAFPRSPMITASNAWELQEASNGRFRLGIGTQVRAHIERRYSSEFDPPGPRLREYVEAVRHIFKAFRGEKLDFQGKYWQMSLLPAAWSPGPIPVPDPPIDIAAVNPWMLRMAGEVADGVHVHPLNHPTYLRDTVQSSVAEGAKAAGRDASDVQLIVPVFTAPGDTPEARAQWWERARFQVAFYGSTPNYGFIFDQLGHEGTTPRIREKQKAGDLNGMAQVVTDDILEHFCVACPWDELSDRLVDRLDGIADRAVSYFAAAQFADDPSTLARWGEVARDVVSRTGG
ncbi:MAG: TIGR03617 family F420-dependent LLM class oxidoreductase [Actinobacteria bacterium]|nr:TIGR03617 family F420-dependent LLM class oxidoreductase [Actinomycetota bacterium]